MNVLNVCSNFDPVYGGGEAERTFQMTRFLNLAEASCRVLTIDTGLSEQRKQSLGEGAVIALPCLLRRFYVPKVSFAYIKRLIDESDVIHLIGHWTILNALVYLAVRKSQKPYVFCPAGALSIFGRSVVLKKIYDYVVGAKIVQNASACIAITTAERDYFISLGVDPEKIMVLPNGVAESDFVSQNTYAFRKKYMLGDRPFILFVGRLNLIKGPDLLLEAFCSIKDKIRDVDLVFAGPDGGLLKQLRLLAESQGMKDRIHFVGYLGGAEKSDAYHAAQLLVVPSRQEAMSIVAIEAGICGTPVLLTDQCGFDQIEEIGGGWVVAASVEGVKQGLLKVMRQRELLKPAKLNIRKLVKEYFTWDTVVHSHINLYYLLNKAKNNNG